MIKEERTMKTGLEELNRKKLELEDRIRRLNADIKAPLEADFHEQAAQLGNREILMRLLEVEKENLKVLNKEIEKASS